MKTAPKIQTNSKLRRLKNGDSLKNEDYPKHEDNLKNEDDPKNEDNLKNYDDLEKKLDKFQG